ncbi:MAG: NAD(+)/NADH kinase [Arenicella sp.]
MFQTIGIYGKYNDATVKGAVTDLSAYLESKGKTVLLGGTTSKEILSDLSNLQITTEDLNKLDLAIVIGGDGTMLHVARLFASNSVPIVGINLGTLGFLTDICLSDMTLSIDSILAGDYAIEERLLLQMDVENQGNIVHSDIAFNEFVIGRDTHAKLLHWKCFVDGVFLTRSRSDGVIVSTPTGSTAYSLAAGGPILQPGLDTVVIVPISPHTLSNRPIVLSANSKIEFKLDDANIKSCHISADGLISYRPEDADVIRIKKDKHRVKMVKPINHDYYATLRSKLNWGEIH